MVHSVPTRRSSDLSPDLWTSELHCAVAHAVHGHRGAWEREGAGEFYLFRHSVFSSRLVIAWCERECFVACG